MQRFDCVPRRSFHGFSRSFLACPGSKAIARTDLVSRAFAITKIIGQNSALRKEMYALISGACCFVYPRSAQVVMAGLDPAIRENTVTSNLSD